MPYLKNSKGEPIFVSVSTIKKRLAIAELERPTMSDWDWHWNSPEFESWNKSYDRVIEASKAMHDRDPGEGAMLMLIDEIRQIWDRSADKQESPTIDSHNTLFGYPVVIDNTIPHDRLIIMTPAVFDDLKKRLEPMMPCKQEQQR